MNVTCPRCTSKLDAAPGWVSCGVCAHEFTVLDEPPVIRARRRFGFKELSLLVAALVSVAGLVRSVPARNSPARDGANIPPPTTAVEAHTETAVASPLEIPRLSATELFEVYKRNELKAEAKFKGALVMVDGAIRFIDRDISNNPYIVLDVPKAFGGVQCYFPESEVSQLMELKKGQRVAVIGVLGSKVLSHVHIKNCTLEASR